MFTSKLVRLSATGLRGHAKLAVVGRQFSTSSAGGQQSRPVAAAVAAGGILTMLALGRGSGPSKGSKKEGKTTESPNAVAEAEVAAPTILQRLEEVEKTLSTMVVGSKNRALVFIKPHAVTDGVDALVKQVFDKQGIEVTKEGEVNYDEIKEKKLIDTHYGAIASRAVGSPPSELNVPAKGKLAFKKMFHENWADVVAEGKVYNAQEICEKLGITGEELDAKWSKLKRGKDLVKFGGGFYCGHIEDNGNKYYVINGFYIAMQAKYTRAPAKIHYYLVEWSPSALSWEKFRSQVIGATYPSSAAPTSLRRQIYENWSSLGLQNVPDAGDNGIHASASPFEAFSERCNWVGEEIESDSFGKALLSGGVDKALLQTLMGDAQVLFKNKRQSMFDLLEDLDSAECLDLALRIATSQP